MDSYRFVQKLLQEQHYKEALSLSKTMLSQHPSSSIYKLLAAYASVLLNKYEDALSFIDTDISLENKYKNEIANILVLICHTSFVEENFDICLKSANKIISSGIQELSDETLLIMSSIFDIYGFTDKSLNALNAVQKKDASLLMSKALLLQKHGDNEHAQQLANDALNLDPSSEYLAINYSTLLMQRGEHSKVRDFLEKFILTNTQCELIQIRLALSIPPVLESQDHACTIRNNIYTALKKSSIAKPIRPEHLITTPPFYLAYHGLNDRILLENISDTILNNTSILTLVKKAKFIRGNNASLRHPGKRKIGFLSWHFSQHTLMSYFFRLLKHTAPQLAECFFIEQPQPDNPFRHELGKIGKIITLPAASPLRLREIVQCVENLDLDILVFLELGMDLTPWLLAFTHPAKIQCTLYGHPVTTGIRNVDFYISPEPMETAEAQQYYTESLVTLPCLMSGFLPVQQPVAKARQRLPAGVTYICAQSLFKIHPAMDMIFRKILQSDKDAKLIFFVSNDKNIQAAFTSRLANVLGPHYNRVHFLQQCSESDFLAIMRSADVVLDTLFFSGGATSYKALGTGIPVVTHEGTFMRGRQTSALYQYMGVAGPIARDIDHFYTLALELAHSPEKKHDISRELLAHSQQLFNINASVEQFSNFLARL